MATTEHSPVVHIDPTHARARRLPGPAPPTPGSMDDAALLAALRNERTVSTALEAVYQHHVPALRGHLRRVGLEAGLAEDAVQEAVIQLWERRASLPDRLSVRAWLAVVAGRRAVDAVRRGWWRHHPLDVPVWPSSLGDDPVTIVLRRERQRQVWRLLDLLDQEERRLIVLVSRDGVRQADIAVCLQVSLTTLTSWGFRVRRYLAAAWLALEGGRQPPPRTRLPRQETR